MDDTVLEAIENLKALKDDSDTSKRFKERASHIITILESKGELTVEKALMELEELNNLDLSTYLRTQIWAIISILESIKK